MSLTRQEKNVEMETELLRIIKKEFKPTSNCVREYFKDASIDDISDIVSAFIRDARCIANATLNTFDDALEWSKNNKFNEKGILYAWQGYGKPNRNACRRKRGGQQMKFWREDHPFTKFGRSTNLKSRFYDYKKKFSEAVQTVTLWVF